MKAFELPLDNRPNASLVCYLQAHSGEMPNTDKRPAVLVVPGGAYKFLASREGEPVALAYMANGFNTFVLKYSVGQKNSFVDALADAEAAVQCILQNAEAWGTDATRLVAAGFSAGGHLAAALGTMSSRRPAALVLCYPCILESTSTVLACEIPSLDIAVDGQTPPTFIFATRSDALVPVSNTLAFVNALEREGVPFEAHVFADGPHGVSLANRATWAGEENMLVPQTAVWLDMSVKWLASLGITV